MFITITLLSTGWTAVELDLLDYCMFSLFSFFSNGKLLGFWFSNESIDISFRVTDVFCISGIIKKNGGWLYVLNYFVQVFQLYIRVHFCYLSIIKIIFAEVNTIVR